jgi:MFS family permease
VAYPNAGAMISRAVDEHNQGQIMGLANAVSALSRVAGPQVASLFFVSVSLDAPFFLGAVIVAPAILLALAAGRAAAATP